MSNISDDELQRMAEDGTPQSDDQDLRAYQKLFDILGEKPIHMSMGLEDAVIAKIELSNKQSARRDYLWLILGVFVLIVTGIVAVALSDFRVRLSDWQREIMTLGICAGLVIMLLNAIERKLLQR
jgi:hypothetical protein